MTMQIGRRAVRFYDYADSIGVGELVSRIKMAERMNAAYSTALYNLERAVSEGLLCKVVGIIDMQVGWLYCLPSTHEQLMRDGVV